MRALAGAQRPHDREGENTEETVLRQALDSEARCPHPWLTRESLAGSLQGQRNAQGGWMLWWSAGIL